MTIYIFGYNKSPRFWRDLPWLPWYNGNPQLDLPALVESHASRALRHARPALVAAGGRGSPRLVEQKGCEEGAMVPWSEWKSIGMMSFPIYEKMFQTTNHIYIYVIWYIYMIYDIYIYMIYDIYICDIYIYIYYIICMYIYICMCIYVYTYIIHTLYHILFEVNWWW